MNCRYRRKQHRPIRDAQKHHNGHPDDGNLGQQTNSAHEVSVALELPFLCRCKINDHHRRWQGIDLRIRNLRRQHHHQGVYVEGLDPPMSRAGRVQSRRITVIAVVVMIMRVRNHLPFIRHVHR
jgi:hypothetical protein